MTGTRHDPAAGLTRNSELSAIENGRYVAGRQDRRRTGAAMAGKRSHALVALLMTVVTAATVAGSQLVADAGAQPPPPKPGKPPGKASSFNFDQYPP
jgi:hypothetical protein